MLQEVLSSVSALTEQISEETAAPVLLSHDLHALHKKNPLGFICFGSSFHKQDQVDLPKRSNCLTHLSLPLPCSLTAMSLEA